MPPTIVNTPVTMTRVSAENQKKLMLVPGSVSHPRMVCIANAPAKIVTDALVRT